MNNNKRFASRFSLWRIHAEYEKNTAITQDGIDPKELLSPLRQEIVESQKARMDFLKYKLLVIGGIGMVGLGIQKDTLHYPLILALIPLCCLYIDILCHHNTMRILVIARFFNKKGCPYESFLDDAGSLLYKIGAAISPDNKAQFMPHVQKKRKCVGQLSPCQNAFKTISDFKNKRCNIKLVEQLRDNMTKNDVDQKKENKSLADDFCKELINRKKNRYKKRAGYFFDLEDYALEWSTYLISVLILLAGIAGIAYNFFFIKIQ